ncbi:FMN-binding protein [Verrucomicrobiota bacterium]
MMKRLYIVFFMVAVAAVFGAGVTGINLLARKTLEQNARLIRQKALIRLFKLADVSRLSKDEIEQVVSRQIDDSETRTDPETGWEFKLLKAYEDAERTRLKSYAFKFRGVGFWAPIEGLLAVSPDLQKTLGCIIVEQKETPGLGGRIEEAFFSRPFEEGLLITPPEKGAPCIYMGTSEPEPGSPQYQRQFDAITGATQTSMAMERMLNDHIMRFNRAMRSEGGQ